MAATLSEDADFMQATFRHFAGFQNVTFSGRAFFRGATFSGRAVFERTTFSKYADFESTTFTDDAIFHDAALVGPESFAPARRGLTPRDENRRPTRFARPPRFFNATLHEDTDWTDVNWPDPPRALRADAIMPFSLPAPMSG